MPFKSSLNYHYLFQVRNSGHTKASLFLTTLQPLAVPKARHKNFHFGRFLILAKELLLSPRALIRLT
ncbi:hypothetical protein C8R44DRAFT_881138 [Mycena epipterygia]|nr:hypothetical protein C8R44DRAFT_881138 [Mycena epipterygia]